MNPRIQIDSYTVKFSQNLPQQNDIKKENAYSLIYNCYIDTDDKNDGGDFFGRSTVAWFSIQPMPGCCGLAISTGSRNYQTGILSSADFHYIKAKIAKVLGFSAMLATVESTNFPEVIGSAKNGWNFVASFTNSRTNHQLGVMFKKI